MLSLVKEGPKKKTIHISLGKYLGSLLIGALLIIAMFHFIPEEPGPVYLIKATIGGTETDYICYACNANINGEMDFEDLKTGKRITLNGNYEKVQIDNLTEKELNKKYKSAKAPYTY